MRNEITELTESGIGTVFCLFRYFRLFRNRAFVLP